MVVVVAAVMRCGCAFPGGAITCVVDDVGDGRDGMPRPFGYRAVMIARACVPDRFGVVGPSCRQRAATPTVNAHGARGFGSAAPQSYKLREREGEVLHPIT
jgi:hypothetical protein